MPVRFPMWMHHSDGSQPDVIVEDEAEEQQYLRLGYDSTAATDDVAAYQPPEPLSSHQEFPKFVRDVAVESRAEERLVLSAPEHLSAATITAQLRQGRNAQAAAKCEAEARTAAGAVIVEFPKWIPTENGSVRVENAEEEAAVLAGEPRRIDYRPSLGAAALIDSKRREGESESATIDRLLLGTAAASSQTERVTATADEIAEFHRWKAKKSPSPHRPVGKARLLASWLAEHYPDGVPATVTQLAVLRAFRQATGVIASKRSLRRVLDGVSA